MINDKIKDQIPLFEMPEIKKDLIADTDRKKVSRTEKKVPAKGEKHAAASRKSSMSSKIPRKKQRAKSTSAVGGMKQPLSGQVPEGDVRLTANIRDELHLKLKITAARRRTTIGELIEELLEKSL